MKRFIGFLSLMFLGFAVNASSQIRPVEKVDTKKEEVKKEKTTKKVEIKHTPQKNLPKSFKVKYQGGLFGYSKKQKGTIRFDEINERLIFFGKDNKEKFSVPYAALLVVHPSHKKVQSGTGRVIGSAPILGAGILGSLIKKKKNYLVIQFRDPDVGASGTINFLLDTGKLVTSAVSTIGQNAEMKPRGDAYIRSKNY